MKGSQLLCLSIFALAAIGSSSFARQAPNPVGRFVRDPLLTAEGTRAESTESDDSGTSSRTGQSVPLPAGAVQVDSTWYDLQDMGSLGARIVRGSSGVVHATYQKDFCEQDDFGCPPDAGQPNPFPIRSMGYATRALNGAWTHLGRVEDPGIRGCCVTELFGGFGAIALTTNGRAAIAQHMNEDGCDDRGDLYLQSAVGSPNFDAYLTPITDPSYLFPQIACTPSGSFAICAEIPKAGSYDEVEEFRISTLAAEGAPFVCPTGWQFSAWKSVISTGLFRDGNPAFPSIATASSGKIGVAVSDFGGNVFLIESSNGTFNAGTVTVQNLTNYSDGAIVASDSTSTQWRPYVNCHLAYDGTTAHVVWSELQARRDGSQIVYVDWHSRVRHWSTPTGIRTVFQAGAEASDFDDLDEIGEGPIAGFNTISVDWPQVGFSDTGGMVHVAWLRFVNSEVDETADAGLPGIITGVGYGDIAVATSTSGGVFSVPRNITRTPMTDERFFSLAARSPNGTADVLFQASATDQAGVVIIGDRGAESPLLLRRIAFLRAPLSGSSSVEDALTPMPVALTVHPNPATSAVRLDLTRVSDSPDRSIDILSVDGRRVQRIAVPPRADEVSWDLEDESGEQVAAGVYFARPGWEPESIAKIQVLR